MYQENCVRQTLQHGIEVVVLMEGETYTTFFSNAPGTFEELHLVRALRQQPSPEAALQAGIDFVNAHQWEAFDTLSIFTLRVRNWWSGDWGYGIHCGGSMINLSGFKNREDAIAACRKRAAEEVEKLSIIKR